MERPIVRALAEGDAAAFDAVFDEHRARIYAWLVRMTRDRAVAEELLQETFVRLARHAGRLRPDTNLRAWLFTVARNLARSHRRWAWLDASRLLTWRDPASTGPSPADLAEASDLQRRVEAALAALPPSSREVLLLVAFEHLDPAEAAVVLGIRPDALRQRLARALAQLTALLGETP